MISLALLALFQLGGGASIGGQAALSPPVVISSLTESADATTVVLQWTTNVTTNSTASCGSENAADNPVTTNANTTTHENVVAGLSPSTGYTCTVTSDYATQTISATTSALATSTPITGISLGTITEYNSTSPPHQAQCDTYANAVSNDGNTYFVCDDVANDNGFSGSQSSAVSLAEFTSLSSTLVAANVNALSGYGACCTTDTPDGYSPKGQGLFAMGGVLYMAFGRQLESQSAYNIQYAGQIIASPDHGATWNNFQYPNTYTSTGEEMSPVTLTMFPSQTTPTNFACSSPVVYGADDGTLGYLVTDNRVDNANAYTYWLSNGQTSGGGCTWDNGDSLYLWRLSRAELASSVQQTSTIQCWVSGDGTLDSNWTNNLADCGAVLTNTGKISIVDMEYIPALNRYLLLTYYYPSFSDQASSVWLAYDCSHPWSCNSTPVTTLTWSTQGYYGEYILQPDALDATFSSTTMRVMFTGDFNGGSATYAPNYATMTVDH